jgi:hypothetical protein
VARTKRKDKRRKNLFKRSSGVIYYEKMTRGKRVKISLETKDWDVAIEALVAHRAKLADENANVLAAAPPTFAHAAGLYLEWLETAGRKPTVVQDRKCALSPKSRLIQWFGESVVLLTLLRSRGPGWWRRTDPRLFCRSDGPKGQHFSASRVLTNGPQYTLAQCATHIPLK